MLLPHVYCSCWTVWSGFAIFPLEVSTQSPLPNSCLEYGGLQCSHISIIHCVFYCFIVFIHGLFHFLVPFNLFFLFISFHSCSFIFMSFPFFSFLVISFHFFLFLPFSVFLEKTITNLNHLHVDPRLSSAAKPVISAKSIPTAPMDPISCPANHIWRYPKCAEVCRSAYICRKYVPSVPSESFSKKWVSQERTCFTLGDSALLDVNLEPLHLFTIKQCLGEALASLLAFSIYFCTWFFIAQGATHVFSCLSAALLSSSVSDPLKGVESTMVPWLAICCSKNPGDHGRYGRMLQPSALCQTSTCGPVAPSPSVREAFASHPPVL